MLIFWRCGAIDLTNRDHLDVVKSSWLWYIQNHADDSYSLLMDWREMYILVNFSIVDALTKFVCNQRTLTIRSFGLRSVQCHILRWFCCISSFNLWNICVGQYSGIGHRQPIVQFLKWPKTKSLVHSFTICAICKNNKGEPWSHEMVA